MKIQIPDGLEKEFTTEITDDLESDLERALAKYYGYQINETLYYIIEDKIKYILQEHGFNNLNDIRIFINMNDSELKVVISDKHREIYKNG